MAQMAFIDIATAAHKAGFRGDAAATIIAITVPESNRIPDRIVQEPPSAEVQENNESYGLTCVNKLWVLDGHFTKEELLTADGNMRAAFIISQKGTTFSAWMTFNAGLHKPSLDAARVAMDARARIEKKDAWISSLQTSLSTTREELANARNDLIVSRLHVSELQDKIAAARNALQ